LLREFSRGDEQMQLTGTRESLSVRDAAMIWFSGPLLLNPLGGLVSEARFALENSGCAVG